MATLIKRWRVSPEVAQKRSNWLCVLGFESFDEYLHSPLWAGIKARALKRDGGKCCYCHAPSVYANLIRFELENLNGKDLSGVRTICGQCLFHEDPRDRQRRMKREVKSKRNDELQRLIREQRYDMSGRRQKWDSLADWKPGSKRL